MQVREAAQRHLSIYISAPWLLSSRVVRCVSAVDSACARPHRCKSECTEIKYLPSSAGLLTDEPELTPSMPCPEAADQCLENEYFPSPTVLSGEICKHPRSYGWYRATGFAGEWDQCASQYAEKDDLCSTADGGIHTGFGVCHQNMCMQCVCGRHSCEDSGFQLDFSKVGKPCPGALCDTKACCIPTKFTRSDNYRSELVLACESEVRTRPELCLVDCKCTPHLICMPCTP